MGEQLENAKILSIGKNGLLELEFETGGSEIGNIKTVAHFSACHDRTGWENSEPCQECDMGGVDPCPKCMGTGIGLLRAHLPPQKPMKHTGIPYNPNQPNCYYTANISYREEPPVLMSEAEIQDWKKELKRRDSEFIISDKSHGVQK